MGQLGGLLPHAAAYKSDEAEPIAQRFAARFDSRRGDCADGNGMRRAYRRGAPL
jgi:hypothetical protein